MKDRLALIISVVAMSLIWLFVTGLLGESVSTWKGDRQHTLVHALAIVSLFALFVLIPVLITQSLRKNNRIDRR